MKKTMRLVYYKGTVPNFGDDLNALVWPAMAPGLFTGSGDAFLGIGTIIGMAVPGDGPIHVFTSGAGYDPLIGWRGRDVRYWAVRGPLSAEVTGAGADAALTDGAILAPLVPGLPEAAAAQRKGTVVIPHRDSMAGEGWDEACAAAGLELLDPRGTPGQVIGRIAGAERVLTESLHGAILADAYGVPWLAFSTSKSISVFKWVDWSLSLGLPLRAMMIPPPNAQIALRYGRPQGPYGHLLDLGRAEAEADFQKRQPAAAETGSGGASVHTLAKAFVVSVAKRSAAVARLLPYSPERTAEMLSRLAAAEPLLSRETVRAGLRDRVLERLAKVGEGVAA
jgi:succinoglycan biosynthesis protein ExoV